MLSRDRLIQFSLAAIVVLLIATALAPVLYQSVLAAPIYDLTRHFTLSNYLRFARSQELHQAIANSFVLAIISTLVSSERSAPSPSICIDHSDCSTRSFCIKISCRGE